MFYKQWHFAQEKKKNKHCGLSFIIFWQRFLNWVHSALDQWLIYFLFQNAPFQSSVLILVGKKKKYDLNENTSINSGKVNILSGAGEECGRLFQKLNYLSRLLGCGTFWNCLINTLSWVNLTIDNYCRAFKSDICLDQGLTYCVSLVTILVSHWCCCSMFEFRQTLWPWNAPRMWLNSHSLLPWRQLPLQQKWPSLR